LNVTDDEEVESGEVECPVCGPNNATVKAIRKAQIESAERHDLFKETLSRSRDGFGVVSDWFGRGVLGVQGLE
jgi:vacuolar protein sorting-associated protein 11